MASSSVALDSKMMMNKNVTNPFDRPPLHPASIPDASSQGDWGAQDCTRHVGPWKEVKTQTIAEKFKSPPQRNPVQGVGGSIEDGREGSKGEWDVPTAEHPREFLTHELTTPLHPKS